MDYPMEIIIIRILDEKRKEAEGNLTYLKKNVMKKEKRNQTKPRK